MGGELTSRRSSVRWPRLRSSVLLKVLVALVLALLLATTVTSAVAARLTRSALANKADELGIGQLNILAEAYAERDNALAVNLRHLAQVLKARGLFEDHQRPELIAELGRASANLDLDLLRVLDGRGRELVPPAGVSAELADPDAVVRSVSEGLSSRILLIREATFVQATSVPTTSGGQRFLLIGGYDFGDRFAFRLRKQVGNVDDVLLVASDRVVGSSLTDPPQRPPGQAGSSMPSTPSIVKLNGVDRMVAYVPVGPQSDQVRAAIGLIMTDPVAVLNDSLSRARLITTLLLVFVILALAWLLFQYLVRPLATLAKTASRVADGDPAAHFEAASHDEIGTLARVLERMRSELQNKVDLIAQQARELRESSQRIVAAEDTERRRLARDLHDGIQRQLVVLRMQLAIAENGSQSEPTVVSHFQQLGSELDSVIEQLREVTQNLYPSILLDRGLAAATRSYVGRLPIDARLACDPEPFPRLALEIESAAYFLVGEAVTNALKYSGASEITIALRLGDDVLTVTVADDGKGFAMDSVERRGGLLHMEDRVKSLGGRLILESAPGAGTRLVATFSNSDDGVTGQESMLLRADEFVNQRSSGERTALRQPSG